MPRDGKYVELEARIEAQTGKAYLLEFTNTGEQCWIPKSQVHDRNEVGDGLWLFSLTEWIAKKNNLT